MMASGDTCSKSTPDQDSRAVQHPFAAGGRGACRHHRGPALSGGHMCTCGRDAHDTATKCSTPTRHRTQCRAQPPMPAKTARGSSKARPHDRSGPCRMVATRRASNGSSRQSRHRERRRGCRTYTHIGEPRSPTNAKRKRTQRGDGGKAPCVRSRLSEDVREEAN